jgi:hypothetical protein
MIHWDESGVFMPVNEFSELKQVVKLHSVLGISTMIVRTQLTQEIN